MAVLAAVATVVALLPLASSALTPTPAAAAPTSADSCDPANGAKPKTFVANPYVTPPWSDAAGWTHPDQFETITAGDLDGDGNGELIGRNASSIEVFTWAPAYPASPPGVPAKLYNPRPGQWVQVLPQGPGATFATADGWWDPSWYSTVRLADVDGVPGDELIARTSDGVNVYRWDKTNHVFLPPVTTGVFDDIAGFGQSHPEHYATITTANVDGKPGDEIIGRGPNGVEAYTWNGSGLTRVDQGPSVASDAAGYSPDMYSSTLRAGDLDGNGRADVVIRGGDGLERFELDATNHWVQHPTLTAWSDSSSPGFDKGWNWPSTYGTIRVGDLDGDGHADVVGRTWDGLDAWGLNPDGSWRHLAPATVLTDAEGWSDTQYALTIGLGDVVDGGGEEVIARANGGVVTYGLRSGAWTQLGATVTQFSNANGWGRFTSTPDPKVNGVTLPPDLRYGTIRAVTTQAAVAQGPATRPRQDVIIGRDATGIRTFTAQGTNPSAAYPDWTDLQGIPIDTNPPARDLDKLKPEARAFLYINEVAAARYWPFAGGSKELLQQFRQTANASKWSALAAELDAAQSGSGAQSGFDPGDAGLHAMNVPRSTYNKVLRDTADWVRSVDELYTHFFGPHGVRETLQTAFLEGASQDVNTIKQNFEQNPAIMALIEDLVWGVIGTVGSLAFAAGLGEAAVAAWAAVGSVAGSGIAGALGFIPGAGTNAFGDHLQEVLIDNLCGASQFLDVGFDQIVQDYGLLTASRQQIEATPSLAPAFDASVNQMRKSRQVWIWQQFANRTSGYNMWIGWCDHTVDTGCSWSKGDPNTWPSPENPQVDFRLIGELYDGAEGHCGYDVLANDPDLKALIYAPSQPILGRPLIGNHQTDTATAGYPYGTVPETAINIPNNIGVLGWRLGTKHCS